MASLSPQTQPIVHELEALRPVLVRILRGRGARAPDADDLAADAIRITFERISAGTLKEPDKLAAFAAQTARHLLSEHRRKSALHPSVAGGDERTNLLPDPEPNAVDRLWAEQRAALVRRVLDGLPTERDRQILIRFYFKDEDKSQICRELQLTSEHFNRVIHRARQRTRQLLDETGDPDLIATGVTISILLGLVAGWLMRQ